MLRTLTLTLSQWERKLRGHQLAKFRRSLLSHSGFSAVPSRIDEDLKGSNSSAARPCLRRARTFMVESLVWEHRIISMRLAFILSCVSMLAATWFSHTAETPAEVSFIRSKDGTRIAVECMGKGQSLLLV